MKVIDFLRGAINDHSTIKNIARGDIPLSDRKLSNGYKLFAKLERGIIPERPLNHEEARSLINKKLNRKAYRFRDAIELQLDYYDRFKDDAFLYYKLTPFISNFFNLFPVGENNHNLDQLEGFDFADEDLTLNSLFSKPIETVGRYSPDVAGYRFYDSPHILSSIFKCCSTPFEVLALAKRLVDDDFLVYVKKIKNGSARLEWVEVKSADERKKLLLRNSTVDIGVGEYFSLKKVMTKAKHPLNLVLATLPEYTVDIIRSLEDL